MKRCAPLSLPLLLLSLSFFTGCKGYESRLLGLPEEPTGEDSGVVQDQARRGDRAFPVSYTFKGHGTLQNFDGTTRPVQVRIGLVINSTGTIVSSFPGGNTYDMNVAFTMSLEGVQYAGRLIQGVSVSNGRFTFNEISFGNNTGQQGFFYVTFLGDFIREDRLASDLLQLDRLHFQEVSFLLETLVEPFVQVNGMFRSIKEARPS